ncbi:MAG: hypothetical protein R6X10_16885 [Desulfobacterales bacterium]
MNQKIFELNLGVEETSLYLLCCSIADNGSEISRKDISSVWNGSEESLSRCIETLERLSVISVQNALKKEDEIYRLMPVETWKT